LRLFTGVFSFETIGARVAEAEDWVVLLEVARQRDAGVIHGHDVRTVLEALRPGVHGGGLYCQDRYVVQVTAQGPGPADVLVDVLSRWGAIVRRLGLPCWKVVRTEVFTPEELNQEFQDVQQDETSVPRSLLSPNQRHPGDNVATN